MNSHKPHNLPDLPSLESVQVTSDILWPMLGIAAVFAGWMGGAALWMLIEYSRYAGTAGNSLAVVIVAACLWCIVAILLTPIRLSTDGSALTLRSLIFTRVVPWTDVKAAYCRTSWTGDTSFILRTSRDSVFLTRPYVASVSHKDCLIASVWQHLRRVGRADELELPDGALSLWEEIGEEVPRIAHWGKPPSWLAKSGAVIGAVTIIAIIPYVLVGARSMVVGVLMLALLAPALAVILRMLLPEELRTVREIAVDDDRLDARCLFSRVRIPWSEVSDARWRNGALVIRAQHPARELQLRYLRRGREAEQVILAVIRHVRSAVPHIPIPFPNTARAELARNSPEWKEYSRLQSIVLVSVTLGLVLGIAAVVLNVPGLLSRLIHAGVGTRFFFPASAWPLVLPFTAGGMALAASVGRWIVRRLAGPDSPLWRKYVHVGSWTCERLMTRTIVAVGIAGLLALPLTLDCYLRVTDSGVQFNRFWSIREQSFSWPAIRSVEVFSIAARPNGVRGTTRTCTIRFDDGSSWGFSDEIPTELRQDDVVKAAEFVARRSGLSVDYR